LACFDLVLKILLTGASGFVGSHILDSLRAQKLPSVLLLRPTSSTRHIAHHLDQVEVRYADFSSPASLSSALNGVTHVIHCAGSVKALHPQEFKAANQLTTRYLVAAANHAKVSRFLYVSSLSALGPRLPGETTGNSSPSSPVSNYGRSKLAAEEEVRRQFRGEYVLIRPPAVYGPRDEEFLPLFKAVRRHLLPVNRQPISLVFVEDLAEAVVGSLRKPEAVAETWYPAHPDPASPLRMAQVIASQLKVRAVPLPLFAPLLFSLCLAGELKSRLQRTPQVLSLQKYPELIAPGWVCNPEPLRLRLGLSCNTSLEQGVQKTLIWYLEHGKL
jgi:nucleoside-diphosphate-sugar epimerase